MRISGFMITRRKSGTAALVMALLTGVLAFVVEARDPVLLAARKERDRREEKPAAGGGQLQRATSPENAQEFWYYVPNSAKRKKRVPFVLSYHGAMGNGEAEIRQWTKFADEHGFIVACPTADLAGARTQAGAAANFTQADFIKEIATITSIVKYMQDHFPIDGRFRMITGFSGGGIPTYWFGLTHPHIFRFVCPRSGNFPPLVAAFHQQNPEVRRLIEQAAASSFLYVFYGEKDHPVILQTAPQTIAWLRQLQPRHLQVEQVPGMGHDSRVDLAVKWFVGAMAQADAELALEAKAAYPQLLSEAAAARQRQEHGVALARYRVAAELEEYYPALGQTGTKEMRKAESTAKLLLVKIQAIMRTRKTEAAGLLQELLTRYPGTTAAQEGEKLLPELPPPPPPPPEPPPATEPAPAGGQPEQGR